MKYPQLSVLGVMSGSSLDGIDLALCRFSNFNNKWTFVVEEANTQPYSDEWTQLLKTASTLPAIELLSLNNQYSQFLGEVLKKFINKLPVKPDLISSHGHTIYHEPKQGFSYQLGDGSLIANITDVVTINDFRNTDILNGGQGAPLVPIGDRLLFGDFKACINLGGIANISYELNAKRIGYDICGANQLLNALSQLLNLPYDSEGKIARTGKADPVLLDILNTDAFLSIPFPKSLSNQYVQEKFVKPLCDNNSSVSDRLATAVDHIAIQIATSLKSIPSGKVLVTGGGAKNRFLINRLSELTSHELIVPSEIFIDYKEAIIFGLMGALRFNEEINCLASVTGARQNSICGRINRP